MSHLDSRLGARRAAALIAGGALIAGTAAAIAPAPAQAHTNNPEIDSAIHWLDSRLGDDDLFTYPDPWAGGAPTTDVSTTIDAGLSVVEVGGDAGVLDRIVSGVEAALPDYLADAPGRYGRAAHFFQEAGEDATDAAGIDLIGWLEDAIDDETGQIGEATVADSYAYVWIVRALEAADSADTDVATQALIDARCEGGGWGYEYEGCNSDADATSWAIVTLADQAGDPAIDAEIEAGLAYLETVQNEDGGYGAFGSNANTTGLVASAYAAVGEDEAATAAADWVRSHQLTGAACDGQARGEGGAIAYGDASLADALEFGIGDASGEWILATAQAFPALHYASDTTPGRGLGLRVPRFAQLGKTVTVEAQRIEPGQRACLVLAGQQIPLVGDGGTQDVELDAPATDKLYRVALHVAGSSVFSPVDVLGPQKLKLTYKKVVKRGSKLKIRVERLAAYESVTVKIGKKKLTGEANRIGLFSVQQKIGRKGGKITVRGEYANRKATGKFRVR